MLIKLVAASQLERHMQFQFGDETFEIDNVQHTADGVEIDVVTPDSMLCRPMHLQLSSHLPMEVHIPMM